ncbi:hypothetical protein ACVBEG_02955 [Pseudomonas sp. GG8]
MSQSIVKSLIDEQIEELPEHMALPADRVLMVFKGLTTEDAQHQARIAGIENAMAWSNRWFLCGMCTLAYQVRA